jgi:phage gp16-like protein
MPLSRHKLIGLIHKGAGALGMDEETRRQWQQGLTGHASCRTMDLGQLQQLVANLRQKGGLTYQKKGIGKKPKVAANRAAQLAKIEALLADKAARQGRPVPWSYAEALAQRLCSVERIEWCGASQLAKVIAALEYDKRRASAPRSQRPWSESEGREG